MRNLVKITKTLIILQFLLWGFYSCAVIKIAYNVKNCTKDTLFMDISISSNPMDVGKFWVYNPHTEICTIYPYDSLFAYGYDSTDVILNNVKGKTQIYPKHNCILPDSLFTMDFSSWSVADTFYLDVIEWKNLRNYPLDIIRKKNLFERRIITKNDFRTMTDDFFSGYMYEYMGNP